jgi:hypothetical protein
VDATASLMVGHKQGDSGVDNNYLDPVVGQNPLFLKTIMLYKRNIKHRLGNPNRPDRFFGLFPEKMEMLAACGPE